MARYLNQLFRILNQNLIEETRITVYCDVSTINYSINSTKIRGLPPNGFVNLTKYTSWRARGIAWRINRIEERENAVSESGEEFILMDSLLYVNTIPSTYYAISWWLVANHMLHWYSDLTNDEALISSASSDSRDVCGRPATSEQHILLSGSWTNSWLVGHYTKAAIHTIRPSYWDLSVQISGSQARPTIYSLLFKFDDRPHWTCTLMLEPFSCMDSWNSYQPKDVTSTSITSIWRIEVFE